jgi:hypothetical protein
MAALKDDEIAAIIGHEVTILRRIINNPDNEAKYREHEDTACSCQYPTVALQYEKDMP